MVRTNALAIAHLMRLLLEGSYSGRELAENSGLHYRTVMRYLAALRKVKAVYISEYGEDAVGRYCIAQYKLGLNQSNKRRPSAVSPAERAKAHRRRKKAIETIQLMAGPIHKLPDVAQRIRNSAREGLGSP